LRFSGRRHPPWRCDDALETDGARRRGAPGAIRQRRWRAVLQPLEGRDEGLALGGEVGGDGAAHLHAGVVVELVPRRLHLLAQHRRQRPRRQPTVLPTDGRDRVRDDLWCRGRRPGEAART
jgi:hypothetical protein